ncbi:translation initiation factor IF-2-like [Gigantopelta aegis]|uniref:translation initiation factor IF-2-like n=1 Tax=Gigantopelta aegis TaxID=1735272 RepID=UPI001B887472|nr:translation initiation factor IF-2-like [Gigantopelta aegis]
MMRFVFCIAVLAAVVQISQSALGGPLGMALFGQPNPLMLGQYPPHGVVSGGQGQGRTPGGQGPIQGGQGPIQGGQGPIQGGQGPIQGGQGPIQGGLWQRPNRNWYSRLMYWRMMDSMFDIW